MDGHYMVRNGEEQKSEASEEEGKKTQRYDTTLMIDDKQNGHKNGTLEPARDKWEKKRKKRDIGLFRFN